MSDRATESRPALIGGRAVTWLTRGHATFKHRMLIYIRHGNDHSDDNKHHHDRGLTDKGKRSASKAATRLIAEHGHPSIVYVSPFQRTLQTAEAMAEQFDRPVEVIQDPRIAQYFGKKKRRRGIKIGRELAALAPLDDDKAAFRLRVDQHIEDVRLANHHRSDVVVWCVTHTIVLKHIGKQFGESASDLDFLDYIAIDRQAVVPQIGASDR
jgi:broad specificity phosphatase PhoE